MLRRALTQDTGADSIVPRNTTVLQVCCFSAGTLPPLHHGRCLLHDKIILRIALGWAASSVFVHTGFISLVSPGQ